MIRIVVVFLVLTLTASSQVVQLSDVLSKHYTAIGGADKFRALKSCIVHGRYVSADGSWKKKYHVLISGQKFRFEMDVQPGLKMLQAYDGSMGWNVSPWSGSLDPQPTNAESTKSLALRSDQFRNDLVSYQEAGTKLNLMASEEIDGSDCFKIVATRTDAVVREYYIDVDSYLIVKVVSKYRVGDEDIDSEVYYSNYRMVQGMMLPYASQSKDGGSYLIEEFLPNASVDDSVFTMPRKS